MNIRVYYHSSIGNTEKLAQVIANVLKVQAEELGNELAMKFILVK